MNVKLLTNIQNRVFNLILLCLFLGVSARSQSFLENLPSSTKWNQINTDHFRVVFQDGFDKRALRVANTLEHLYLPASKSLQIQPNKIDVILQNENMVANGFVSFAPLRSEFFTNAPQNYTLPGTNDWLDLLSVHEFRHVVQRDKSMTGFTGFVNFVLGQSASSGMAFAGVPSWYWEGDAVAVETALSNSGRGRMPNFDMAMRASFLENGPFNYHKQYLRSFKDFVPNHYLIGYHMNSYLRLKNGMNIWEPITDNAWKKSLIPFTFSNAIKKSYGKYVVDTYNEMADSLVQIWKAQLEAIEPTEFQTTRVDRHNTFTNYRYPQARADGSVIVQKSGLSDITKFVKINADGTESKIVVPGQLNNPGYITIGGNLLVWTEFQFDPRWQKRTYSVVRTYNLTTKQMRRITTKTKYSGAAVHPQGGKIVVVNNLENGDVELRIISSDVGTVLQIIDNPDNSFYSMPRWSDDGEYIVVIKHGKQSKGVVRISPESGAEEVLLPQSSENIGHPVILKGYLLYNSDISGIDNIYALHVESKSRYQVTSAKYGSFNPTVSTDGKQLIYNNFSRLGMDIAMTDFDPASWTPLDEIKGEPTGFHDHLVEQEANPDALATVPNTQYPSSKYSPAKGLFNIHSWGPYFSTSILDYEIGVFFQDVMSLNRGFVGYELDAENFTGKWKAEYTYQGFFPAIDLEVSTGTRMETEFVRDTADVIHEVDFDWSEDQLSAGLRIPLAWADSKYFSSFSIGNNILVNRVREYTNDFNGNGRVFFNQQDNGSLISNEFEISYSALLKTNPRDIRSRWGFQFNFQGVTTIAGDFSGGLSAILSQVFVPGIARHHSLNFLFGYQHRGIDLADNNYWYPNRMPFPRGYSSSSWQDFYTMRANYDLTLWNADVAAGPFLNIQRIRARLFYDTGYGQTDVTNFDTNRQIVFDRAYNSTGAEIWFDVNIMRLQPILSGGARVVYIPDQGGVQFELVIGNIGI